MRAGTFLLAAAVYACVVGLLTGCYVIVPLPLSSLDPGAKIQDLCQRGIFYYDTAQYYNAYRVLLQSAAVHNPCGLNNLGVYYFEGKAVPKNLSKAIGLWRRSASLKYPGAEYNLGVLYEGKEGVAADLPRAQKLLKAAAAQGYVQALVELGSLSDDRYLKTKSLSDFQNSKHYYVSAYKRGSCSGAINLAYMYSIASNVPNHYRRSFEWENRCAWTPVAQGAIGYDYIKGQGVKKDWSEGMRWLRLAERNGNHDARRYLYYIEPYGPNGIPQSTSIDPAKSQRLVDQAHDILSKHQPITLPLYKHAVTLFRQAANIGDVDAQQALADEYYSGVPTMYDPKKPNANIYLVTPAPLEAYVWYSIASDHRGLVATQRQYVSGRRLELQKKLSRDQLQRANTETSELEATLPHRHR